MSGEPKTTFVATLLYRETMALGFQQIVAEFNEAFRNRPQLPYAFGRPYDDFAVFDIDGAHIVVAHGDTAEPGAERGRDDRALIALALSAEFCDAPALAPRFERLLRSVVGRIQRPFPADAVLWSQHQGAFDPDSFDALMAELTRPGAVELSDAESPAMAPAAAAPAAEPAQAAAAEPEAPARPKRPRRHFAPVEDVVNQLGETPPATAETAAPPAPIEVANSLPQLPEPMLEEAARIRRALYPPELEVQAPAKAPTVQRVTIYTLNTALILVAMPVGVAVLTYNVLGRESMTATARSMALAGFGVAISHTPLFGQMLATLI